MLSLASIVQASNEVKEYIKTINCMKQTQVKFKGLKNKPLKSYIPGQAAELFDVYKTTLIGKMYAIIVRSLKTHAGRPS